jgi:hypothetical protein
VEEEAVVVVVVVGEPSPLLMAQKVVMAVGPPADTDGTIHLI